LLLLERIAPSDFHVAVFGAGHVGKALVSVLAGLPCRITWIDSRVDQFPSSVPSNATVERTDAPEYTVRQLPPDSYVLIMTHSHPLDLQICEGALRRDDFTYVGLIGSKTKRTKFERRLLERGLEVTALARLTCPIGVPGVTSKHPAVIAVAVAAQLLQAWSATQSRRASASPASVAQSFGFACLSRAELRLRLRLSPSSAG
jgi:xanthine dehydrogenase accessory factor